MTMTKNFYLSDRFVVSNQKLLLNMYKLFKILGFLEIFIQKTKFFGNFCSNRFMQIVYFIRDRFRWQEIGPFQAKNKI